MTIETSNITSGPYAGNDVTTSFSYTFRVDSKDELLVFETTGDGEPVTLTVDVDYTVNDVGTDGGGTIDRIAGALPTGSTWYIRSNRDTLQETDFESQGSFFPDVHERAFDKLTFLIQQLYDVTARSFRLSDADPDGGVVNLTLPAVADRQNRILTFDENGDIAVAALIGTFRGDWTTSTVYSQRDLYTDPATENLYFVQEDHTSTTVAADLAAGRVELLIDAEYVKQQADLAEASATDAQTAQTGAELAETNAETAQAAAELAQTGAQTAQTAAELAETNAEAAQAAAELAQAEAEAALYDFKGRYFGGLSADPLVDLNGDALNAGDVYFNTTSLQMRTYNGATWEATFDVVKASTAQAEAGTDDATYMTPLKTKQAGATFFAKHIAGLVPSNAADADHDITISAGVAVASNDNTVLQLASAITKQIDATWAAGDNAGGLFTGTVAADTTYHLFIIQNDSTGAIDAGFDTSLTAANIPAGYTNYRRVASFLTDASANMRTFNAIEVSGGGVKLQLNTTIIDLDDTTPATAQTDITLSVPQDIKTEATLHIFLQDNVSQVTIYVAPTNVALPSPSGSTGSITIRVAGGVGSFPAAVEMNIPTDTAGQVRYRSDDASVQAFQMYLRAYEDFRRD